MRKFALISIGILALCSCRKGQAPEPPEGEEVVFTASAADYLSKASDSVLEARDSMGIFAFEPINAINVKGVVRGDRVVPEFPVLWEANQSVPTRFSAVMPYDVTAGESLHYTFYVKSDQADYESYRESDLRYAVMDAKPGMTVDFYFQHALSKLVVVMTDGSLIKSVTTGNLALSANLNLVDGSLTAGSYRGSMYLGKAQEGNGTEGFVAILVPQSGLFPLDVTLQDGDVLHRTLESPATFLPGIAYKAEIDPGTATFTVGVTPWTEGGTLDYGKPKLQ